jgi:sigma-B regulation protein RsbU (phosphoserine phosphatase)
LGGTALIFLAAGALLFARVRQQMLEQSHEAATALASEAGHRIQQRLARVADTTEILAGVIALDPDHAEAMLRSALAQNPDLSGLAAVYTPGGSSPVSPFVSRRGDGGLDSRDMRHDPSPYWEKPWFLTGLHCTPGCWQKHFYSQSRQRELINYSVAIAEDGHPAGMVNADVSLEWLASSLQALGKPTGAYAFVLDGDGSYLAHDNPAMVGHLAALPLQEALNQREAGRARLAVAPNPEAGGPAVWVYFFPIEGTRWSLGLAMPDAAITNGAREAFTRAATLGLLALLTLAAFILVTTRRTMAPLATLTARAEQVARGALEFELPPARRRDEVGRLTQAFDRMRNELALHLTELTRTTRERQRLASELEIARQIQTALLPGEHYLDAHCENFELHALLRPARAVGGDLYSYFMLDDRRFCVMVGDVSDKGIPAALFMARTITLAKALAPGTSSPQQLLIAMDRELGRNNDSCMFVSLLCGMLDTRSGELVLSSAGHEPPVLCDANGTRLLSLETGAALGLDEASSYPTHTLRMQPGQTVLMYTDGITEATDIREDMYGSERMLARLAGLPAPDGAGLTRELLADVDQFAADAGQADDITVLALTWHHARDDRNAIMLDLIAKASMDDVFMALDRCESSLRKHGVAQAVREDIRLVLEELMVNMVQHGHAGGTESRIDLHVRLAEAAVLVELHHDGHAFDPLQARMPVITGDIADREEIGGFGIHLVRAMASDFSYCHDDQGNHLLLRFIHPASTESAS